MQEQPIVAVATGHVVLSSAIIVVIAWLFRWR